MIAELLRLFTHQYPRRALFQQYFVFPYLTEGSLRPPFEKRRGRKCRVSIPYRRKFKEPRLILEKYEDHGFHTLQKEV